MKKNMTKARYVEVLKSMGKEFEIPYEDREDAGELDDQAAYALQMCAKLVVRLKDEDFQRIYYGTD